MMIMQTLESEGKFQCISSFAELKIDERPEGQKQTTSSSLRLREGTSQIKEILFTTTCSENTACAGCLPCTFE